MCQVLSGRPAASLPPSPPHLRPLLHSRWVSHLLVHNIRVGQHPPLSSGRLPGGACASPLSPISRPLLLLLPLWLHPLSWTQVFPPLDPPTSEGWSPGCFLHNLRVGLLRAPLLWSLPSLAHRLLSSLQASFFFLSRTSLSEYSSLSHS